jgi:hypothetical protein
VIPSVHAADEPFLKPNDVIALVGGEDMVACAEYGYLESNLHRAYPDLHLKVRCLAWEGDTVYEQPRMLNYPTLEQQLDQIGATVVLAEFGLMESLDPVERVEEFISAYRALIERLKGASKRRVIIKTPSSFDWYRPRDVWLTEPKTAEELAEWRLGRYMDPLKKVAKETGVVFADLRDEGEQPRDGVHRSVRAQILNAHAVMAVAFNYTQQAVDNKIAKNAYLYSVIVAKNRLWERYRRPQNWAFLAGDRVSQPSSRDWRDPNKRWFPEEMEQFVPLIEKKDKEIWDLAAKLKTEKE